MIVLIESTIDYTKDGEKKEPKNQNIFKDYITFFFLFVSLYVFFFFFAVVDVFCLSCLTFLVVCARLQVIVTYQHTGEFGERLFFTTLLDNCTIILICSDFCICN